MVFDKCVWVKELFFRLRRNGPKRAPCGGFLKRDSGLALFVAAPIVMTLSALGGAVAWGAAGATPRHLYQPLAPFTGDVSGFGGGEVIATGHGGKIACEEACIHPKGALYLWRAY